MRSKQEVIRNLKDHLERLRQSLEKEFATLLQTAQVSNKPFLEEALNERRRKLGEALDRLTKAPPESRSATDAISAGSLIRVEVRETPAKEFKEEWWLIDAQLSTVTSKFQSGELSIHVRSGDMNNGMGTVLGKKVGDEFTIPDDGRTCGPVDLKIVAHL